MARKKQVKCSLCGENTASISHEQEVYCEPCFKDNFTTCECCAEMVAKECVVSTQNEKAVCDTCIDSHYMTCSHCQVVFHADDGVAVHNDDMVCGNCAERYYRECEYCGELFRPGDLETIGDGDYDVCRHCYEMGGYFCCDSCGVHSHGDNYGGNGYCESCYNHRYDDGYYELAVGGWHPDFVYHHHDQQRFSSARRNAVYFGLELETDNYGQISDAIDALNGLSDNERIFWLTEDGSLNHGIEITSQPMTYRAWMEQAALLHKIRKVVLQHGGVSYKAGTCGVHIHRSRSDLRPIDEAKLIAFMRICQSFVECIAQRGDNSYAAYGKLRQIGRDKKHMIFNLKRRGHHSKYNAINFGPSRTIEFRVFKGTLVPTTLLGYFGFVHFVVKFCKSLLLNEILETEDKAQPVPTKQYGIKLWSMFCAFVLRQVGKDNIFPLVHLMERKRVFMVSRTANPMEVMRSIDITKLGGEAECV